MNRWTAMLAFAVLQLIVLPAQAQQPARDRPEDFGRFPSPAQTQWLDDGRRMVLLRDFSFVEPDGTRWEAKAAQKPPRQGDLVIDGASIPPVFWSVVGGPYEGLYRNASIIHDAECSEPYKHRWQDVHRLFFRASRAGGTSEIKSKLIFAAVWHFGPRWAFKDEPYTPHVLQRTRDAVRLIAYIVKNPTISLPAIEALSSETLQEGVTQEELERFMISLEECNDPNGYHLGAGVARHAQHDYSTTMSTPDEPCPGGL